MSKLVSVIMPVYNGEATILKAIESVLDQTYRDYELIIIDDGSTDNTGDICKKIIDKRMKYVHVSNYGVSRARNYGLNLANGEYIVFIDSDDLYDKRYIELMVEKANDGYDLVVCGYKNCGISKKTYIPNNTECTDKLDFICSLQRLFLFNQVWNKIYRADIIKENRLKFNDNLSIAEDWNFNVDYLKWVSKYSVVTEPLYNYKINPNGLGFSYREDAGEIKMRIIDKMSRLFDSGENSSYISDSYIKQYYALFSSIVDKRSGLKGKDARKRIKEVFGSKKYDMRIKRISADSFRKRILCNALRKRSIHTVYYLAKAANIYDRFNKSIKFGIRRG